MVRPEPRSARNVRDGLRAVNPKAPALTGTDVLIAHALTSRYTAAQLCRRGDCLWMRRNYNPRAMQSDAANPSLQEFRRVAHSALGTINNVELDG